MKQQLKRRVRKRNIRAVFCSLTFIESGIDKVIKFFGTSRQWNDSSRFHRHTNPYTLLRVSPFDIGRFSVIKTLYSLI